MAVILEMEVIIIHIVLFHILIKIKEIQFKLQTKIYINYRSEENTVIK